MGFLSPAPYHILSYGTLLGSTIFHTFVGSIVSYRVLPPMQFAHLKSHIFPIYFAMQTALPAILALTYPGSRNPFGAAAGVAGVLDVSNRWTVLAPLAGALLCSVANLAMVAPATAKVVVERWQQEKEDGKKSYDAPPHSQEMAALNKRFGTLHYASLALNMGTLIATVVYGVTLSSRLM